MFRLFKKRKTRRKNPYRPTGIVNIDKRNAIYQELDDLRQRYEKIIKEHQTNGIEIEKLYKKAIYQETIENNYTEKCIILCEKDIELAPTLALFYRKECELMNKAYGHKSDENGFGIPIYNSFVRISQLYEKRKMYAKALGYVQQSLSLGFKNDGSKSNMETRELRLERKLQK